MVTVHAPNWKDDVHDVMVGGDERTTKKTRKRPLDARRRHPALLVLRRHLRGRREPQRESRWTTLGSRAVWEHARITGTMDRNFYCITSTRSLPFRSRSYSILPYTSERYYIPILSMNKRLCDSGCQVRLWQKVSFTRDVENRHTNDFFGDDISMVVATGELCRNQLCIGPHPAILH